jgi:hypothetical protein
VETPTALTPRQRALLEELQGSLGDDQGPARARFAAKVRETLG